MSNTSGNSLEPGIAVNRLSFAYGTHTVFADLSFSVARHHVCALVGRSGTGKSTLLLVIAGLYQPTSGSITLNGSDGIRGVIFQESALLGWLTVLQNVLFPHYRHSTAAARATAQEYLQRVGLARHEDSYPHELSLGMRRRVEFVRALLADREYLLADEPFASLDFLTQREMWDLWTDSRRIAPRTMVITTHSPEEAARLSDVVLPLRPTNPASLGPPLPVPQECHDRGTAADLAITEFASQIVGAMHG